MRVMASIRVLLADDHAIVRSGICRALHDLPDIEIVGEVGDGPSLVAALTRLQPDLLVIDVMMPDFEPIATIRQIRAQFPAMKILVVSAYDDDAYVQGLLGVGVNGYHLKDQPLSDLKLAVERVLAGERWLSSTLISKLLSYSEFGSPTSSLTDRQRELLRLLLQGYDNQSLARETGLSVKTIENHLTRIYRHLNVQSRLEAVHYVREHPEVLTTTRAAPAVSMPDLLPQSKLTALLVDDNARYRSQLRRMVGRACPQAVIYEAGNTQEAARLVGADATPVRADGRDPGRRGWHPLHPPHQGNAAILPGRADQRLSRPGVPPARHGGRGRGVPGQEGPGCGHHASDDRRRAGMNRDFCSDAHKQKGDPVTAEHTTRTPQPPKPTSPGRMWHSLINGQVFIALVLFLVVFAFLSLSHHHLPQPATTWPACPETSRGWPSCRSAKAW